jgi:hypothetical protein
MGADERHTGDRQEHALGEAATVAFATLAGGDRRYRVAGEAEGLADQVTPASLTRLSFTSGLWLLLDLACISAISRNCYKA